MKVWITKYALTNGILERDASVDGRIAYSQHMYYGKNQWHASKEAAIECAKQMQADRIASLTRSLNKIKALDFGGAK